MQRRDTRGAQARGFTLIEIILATVLFSLLMASYYEIFNGVLQLEEYARESRSFSNVGPAVLDLIEDDIHSLFIHPRADDAFPFRGNDDSMGSQASDSFHFVGTRASIGEEQIFGDEWTKSPVNELGYRVARSSSRRDTRRLYRRESYYVDGTPLDGGDYYEVYDRVHAFDVTYVGYRVEEEDNSEATEERLLETFESWDSEERKGYPTAMIVKLTIEAPQLTVPIDGEDTEPTRRTFFRVIHFVHADDVDPPAAPDGNANGNNPGNNNPGNANNGAPGR